jgi:uncharacterized metal-binding protein
MDRSFLSTELVMPNKIEIDSQSERRLRESYARLPLVYACSGCSSAAQLANQMALRLDHRALAEMSCIAGVGAGVKPLARTARSGRPILALDGCPLHCVRHALAAQGVAPTVHVDLSGHGVRKDLHRLPDAPESEAAWSEVVLPALQAVSCMSSEPQTSKDLSQ